MPALIQIGDDYKNCIVISSKQLEIAKMAAGTYEWEGENKDNLYPQYLKCKKTGANAVKKNKDDDYLWNMDGTSILLITSDEYIIRDIIK